MTDCKFCNEGNDIIPIMNQGRVLNRKLYDSEDFYVTVSVGALVEGHLLIIPKYDLGEWDWHKDYKANNIIQTVERLRDDCRKL